MPKEVKMRWRPSQYLMLIILQRTVLAHDRDLFRPSLQFIPIDANLLIWIRREHSFLSACIAYGQNNIIQWASITKKSTQQQSQHGISYATHALYWRDGQPLNGMHSNGDRPSSLVEILILYAFFYNNKLWIVAGKTIIKPCLAIYKCNEQNIRTSTTSPINQPHLVQFDANVCIPCACVFINARALVRQHVAHTQWLCIAAHMHTMASSDAI